MNTFSISGLPALAWTLGFAVLGSLPVWAAAKLVGAADATLMKSGVSLVVGTVIALGSASFAGGWALLIAPIAYLLAFKFILKTSLLGALILAVLALAGYAAMFKVIGGGMQFS